MSQERKGIDLERASIKLMMIGCSEHYHSSRLWPNAFLYHWQALKVHSGIFR